MRTMWLLDQSRRRTSCSTCGSRCASRSWNCLFASTERKKVDTHDWRSREEPTLNRRTGQDSQLSVFTVNSAAKFPPRLRSSLSSQTTVFLDSFPHSSSIKMNSLGKSSKWPSYDSLPSTSSFPPSENEQTEDEADVFSEGEGDSNLKSSLQSKFGGDQCELYPEEAKHLSAEAARSSSVTPGDLTFAKKCADLHRFIYPLLELLRGLKTGRFDKGLTSFQQSVAIDRLQRILGILQKPEMGEKYLQNLLQIEMLLKMWFPQKSFKSIGKSKQTSTPALSPKQRKNQLHIPVKKRKLSWLDPDVADSVPVKRQHRKHQSCDAATTLDTTSTCLPPSPENGYISEEKTPEVPVDSFSERQRCSDRTVLVSRSYLCSRGENENPSEISLPCSCGSPATQDCSVSSSNNVTTTDSP